MKEKVKELIMSGDFQKAKVLVELERDDLLRDIVLELGFDEESISAYSFVSHLITNNENSILHHLASELLSLALCHLPGAYSGGLFHARRAIELSPQDVHLKEYLLFFHVIPERLISEEEAIEIARDIVYIIPDSIAAQNILKNK